MFANAPVLILMLLLLTLLTSCHSLPRAEALLSQPLTKGQPVIRDGRDQVLSAEASAAAIDQAVGEHTDREWLHELMMREQMATGATLTAGNHLEILVDGPETFEHIFRDIREAEHHVHIETFIFRDDEIGQRMADLLIEKAQEGVQIRVIYDSFGSGMASKSFFERMEQGGVQLYEWRPFNAITMIPWWHSHIRHHRKMFIIDGTIGYTGGMNISRVYLKSSFTPPYIQMIDNRWRDTQVRLLGPAVGDLQRLFVELWTNLTGDQVNPFLSPLYFPPLEASGDSLVRVVDSEGGTDDYEIYNAHVIPFAMARRRIWATQGYFAPNERFLQLLVDRAEAGVDVQLLLPGFTDVWVTFQSSQGTYTPLLKGGVQLYERQDALLHAKSAIVDDVWTTIGSTNLDWRSFAHNNELNLTVIDRGFAERLEETFLADRAVMEGLTNEQWEQRGWKKRVMEYAGDLVRYWL